MGFDVQLNKNILNKLLESELKIKVHTLADLKHLTGWLFLAQQRIQISLDPDTGKVSAILLDEDNEPKHKVVVAEFNPGLISDSRFKNMSSGEWTRES